MSAFVVHPITVDYLLSFALWQARQPGGFRLTVGHPNVDLLGNVEEVLAGIRQATLDETTATAWGQVLVSQNIRSVRYRYPELSDEELPGDEGWVQEYRFCGVYGVFNPVHVLKVAACLEYQSCETPDYDRSLAAAILRCIKALAVFALPGYDDAPWGLGPHALPAGVIATRLCELETEG